MSCVFGFDVGSRLIGRGAQTYLRKPLELTELARAIDHGVELPHAA